MPISFAFVGDDVIWTQQFLSPTVYLDTFAIRAISESDELSVRFSQGIKRRNGTWLLAPVSMGEFALSLTHGMRNWPSGCWRWWFPTFTCAKRSRPTR